MPFSSRTIRPQDWALVQHFTPDEFKEPGKMGFEFIRWLDELRDRAGVPMRITSSYRSPDYNRSVGGASDSAHSDVPCNSVDIGKLPDAVSDPNWNYARYKIIQHAILLGCTRIGMYPNGSLHLDRSEDKRPAPRIWIAV